MQTLVDRVAAHIKARFLAESSGHDWHHINRVWQLTRRIAAQEGANGEIAELGALVHDIADWKFHGGDDSAGPRAAETLLRSEGASDELIAAVVDIVAIGIARCFAYGGHAGRLMHDPDEPPVLHQTAAAYKASKGASLNHFYEKLFLLKDRMNTPTGRALAEQRHRFMEEFVAQFLAEWNIAA